MRGASHDILFLCDHCGGGAVLETEQLRPVTSTALMPAPGRRATTWRPGWILEAHVEVGRRYLANGTSTPGWRDARTFVIPAFNLSLDELDRLSRALSAGSGTTGELPHQPITGGSLSLEDARTFARYLVVGDEARRPDMLASVQVFVNLTDSRLVALPFEERNHLLSCAVTGISVRSRIP
jgi:hypothetical protein